MARFVFRLPDIGEGIAEAEIVGWHVSIGDMVEEDGRLADMMTDKATVEMESPVAGKVVELTGEVGDMVAVGAPLAVIETEGEDAPAPKSPAVEARVEAETPEAGNVEAVLAAESPAQSAGGSGAAPADAPRQAAPPKNEGLPGNAHRHLAEPVENAPQKPAAAPRASERRQATRRKVLASPAVRLRARELGIDLADVRPAEGGRMRHADLDAFVSYGSAQGYAPAGGSRADEQVRVVGLRRRIAENMAAAKRHIPHFSYVEECDVTDLEAMRAQLNEHRSATLPEDAQDEPPRAKLTMLPFIITAICRTLPRFRMINAHYDDEAGVVTRHGAVHLGIATQTEAGLMVPVLHNAQALNLWQLAREIARLAAAARDGSIGSDDLSGSTLTVTSLGPLGGIASTPVINRPEVAIIAPNRIVERPMFVPDGLGGERLAKRKLMNLSISCDHRVVDGWDAASFVQEVKRLLESPALLLADPG